MSSTSLGARITDLRQHALPEVAETDDGRAVRLATKEIAEEIVSTVSSKRSSGRPYMHDVAVLPGRVENFVSNVGRIYDHTPWNVKLDDLLDGDKWLAKVRELPGANALNVRFDALLACTKLPPAGQAALRSAVAAALPGYELVTFALEAKPHVDGSTFVQLEAAVRDSDFAAKRSAALGKPLSEERAPEPQPAAAPASYLVRLTADWLGRLGVTG